MKIKLNKINKVLQSHRSQTLICSTALVAVLTAPTAIAQESQSSQADGKIEEVVVTGMRSSLTNALAEKRESNNLVEVIQAVDIGKLPDQNLAEVLENVSGIQITRTAGVGTGVQIRGTNANRTEINGVSTVGSGAGRSGISFDDVSASIISAVEVTKAPDAKTIEGSVGGTINLRTIRPLELNETLAAVRIQGESSSLSDDGMTPRFSGTYGDNWETSAGNFGVVISGSYAEQDVTAFRPRVDRDHVVTSDGGTANAQDFDFLGIQFLNQDYDNFEYETVNFSGSLEWEPNDDMRLYFDSIVNDQERYSESVAVQASGVSDLIGVSVPSEFETVDFGSLGGQDLGSIQAAIKGVIPVEDGGADPNLRFAGDTISRVTKSEIFRLGGDWSGENLKTTVELSSSRSESTKPQINTTLNFINPNAAVNSSNENGTPFVYDLTGGSLAFDIAFDEANAPSAEDMMNPANYMLRSVDTARDLTENTEDAFRTDFEYNLDWSVFTTLDFGYRYSKATSMTDQIRANVSLRNYDDSPTGDLFAELLTAGPDNFGDADGRDLFVQDFLMINPDMIAADQDNVLSLLNDAVTAHGGSIPVTAPTSEVDAFFDIEETTNALYAQANFSTNYIRGNIGLRYLETEVASTGNSTTTDGDGNPTVSLVTTVRDYDFLLPRLNIVADLTDEIVLRAGWGKDIRRPDFNDLSTSVTYPLSPNTSVAVGNPGLTPEEVTSFDISAEWYFAEASVLSIGYFHKTRKDLHVGQQNNPYEDPETGYRDIVGPECEEGGIWNPIADINVFGPVGVGVCVPWATTINDTGETTQEGVELAIQYDLAGFEDQLGWASGFGILANYTFQEFSGGEAVDTATSRASAIFAASTGNDDIDVSAKQQLIDLSENAYNFTLYYEKYGLSARMRYTWREAYRSEDFGSTFNYPWGFPVVQEDRGQLNASVSYDVTDQLNIGIEAVNLTESKVEQSCVNEGALLCFQGLTDRRVTVGASYRW
ncbi:TonB-dependent receptor [Gilvimarinus agarilyticus]|uniref:TonB-dependent receptor n=1 Tax=Gilvimarinus sp. 2_MG-2023 TaxID=3062666 RepID=UPI001C09EC0F|nr:TonB-dependent receptor [Gilvimarinus sp. 2_MG-2023]MBU2884402.1 TonB-dependent receptor [Gilvimarinus agarilyticus]MDO6569538.1 TonB-dependent receptor [Gilvimarinus sp. 2_MG-2023]